jgi:hypothetical protein
MDILQAIGYGDKVKAEHLNDFPENGIHRHLAILAAFCQASEVGKDRAEKLIEKKAAAAVLRRPLQANEIKDAVSNIYRGKTRNRGEGEKTSPRPSRPPKSKTQQVCPTRVEPLGLVDLWELSPIRLDEGSQSAEEVIDELFPGNPLLCCGLRNSDFRTLPREDFRGAMADLSLIVPSPMSKPLGRTMAGNLSEHTLDATGPRKYFVAEFDEGSDDEQAAKIWHLQKNYAPLTMVVHSGGKSLHAWFRTEGQSEGRIERFMEICCGLGADPATKTRSQFVRMPEGLREPGVRQKVFFFNPPCNEVNR